MVEPMAEGSSPPPAVAVNGLRRWYGNTLAVDGVDLWVPRGAFAGLLGPNGAGKTTTLHMLTGLLRPHAGTVRVAGVDVWADPTLARTRFGVLPADLPMFERLTGAELIGFVGALRSLPPDVVGQRRDDLLGVLDLAGAADVLVADYSTGMRKKVGLALALLHAPDVLVLDEPFESVDPVSARVIQDVLVRYCATGGTVLLSSHVIDQVQRVCDHVAILHRGRIVTAGPTEQVRGGRPLEEVFIEVVGAGEWVEGRRLDWLSASAPPPPAADPPP